MVVIVLRFWGRGLDWKGAKETFWGYRNVIYLVCGGGYTNVYMCQKSNCTLKVSEFYCLIITVQFIKCVSKQKNLIVLYFLFPSLMCYFLSYILLLLTLYTLKCVATVCIPYNHLSIKGILKWTKKKKSGYGFHMCMGILKMKSYCPNHYHVGVIQDWLPLRLNLSMYRLSLQVT